MQAAHTTRPVEAGLTEGDMMSKGTNKGTGRKRLSLADDAYERSLVNYPNAQRIWQCLAYRTGYLAGWRAVKREGKR